MTDRDMQRWSREVAEDPGAPSFVRLARAYRRQGRRGSPATLSSGAWPAIPSIWMATPSWPSCMSRKGTPVRARDEWETVVRLEPGHFDASRGLGFLALERKDFGAARTHLEAAAAARPGDPTVGQALQVLDRKVAAAPRPAPPATPKPVLVAAPPQPAPSGRNGGPRDPARLFEPLGGEPCFAGALVLDAHGMVLAGFLDGEGEDSGALLGALLDGVVAEAHRTTELVDLGAWQEVMIDCEHATMHVAPLPHGGVVLAKMRPRTPAGWVVRLASSARNLARRFVEESP
jgi:predicted regulator of Ras-like GTPase activity (Roadblock/LC7/MglB family)